MSALGQKRTYAAQKGMSALPPKADMCGALGDVRFGPIADMASGQDGLVPTIGHVARNRKELTYVQTLMHAPD